jgi:hypothetical protein
MNSPILLDYTAPDNHMELLWSFLPLALFNNLILIPCYVGTL